MADEYFIRGPEEETAQGPYTIDALLTLAEADRITKEHLYFDPNMESWAPLRTNDALMAEVFPEKKSLSLRKKTAEEIDSINTEEDEAEVKVEDMLAAAEGQTSETKHVRTKKEWEERTAGLSVPLIGSLLLVSALSVLYPSWSIINNILNEAEGAYMMLFQNPILILGAMDLLMAGFLFLNATEIFPLIRFRAMIAAGFFSVIYLAGWVNGDPDGIYMALSSLSFGCGLYACTLTLSFTIMTLSAAAGFAGVLGLIWYSNLVPLLFG